MEEAQTKLLATLVQRKIYAGLSMEIGSEN